MKIVLIVLGIIFFISTLIVLWEVHKAPLIPDDVEEY